MSITGERINKATDVSISRNLELINNQGEDVFRVNRDTGLATSLPVYLTNSSASGLVYHDTNGLLTVQTSSGTGSIYDNITCNTITSTSSSISILKSLSSGTNGITCGSLTNSYINTGNISAGAVNTGTNGITCGIVSCTQVNSAGAVNTGTILNSGSIGSSDINCSDLLTSDRITVSNTDNATSIYISPNMINGGLVVKKTIFADKLTTTTSMSTSTLYANIINNANSFNATSQTSGPNILAGGLAVAKDLRSGPIFMNGNLVPTTHLERYCGIATNQFKEIWGKNIFTTGDGGISTNYINIVSGTKPILIDASIALNIDCSGNVRPDVDNSKTLGDATRRWNEIFSTNATINTSDRNMKTDINESTLGLDFINALTPVSYKWINRQNIVSFHDETVDEKVYEINEDGENVETIVQKVIKVPDNTPSGGVRTHYGLIAQDVKAVLDNMNMSTLDFAAYIDTGEIKGLRYEEFIAPLIKAVQELTIRLPGTNVPHPKEFSFTLPYDNSQISVAHNLSYGVIKGFRVCVESDVGMILPFSNSENFLFDAWITETSLCAIATGVNIQGKLIKWVIDV